MNLINQGLLITVIGMGLVFLAIVLLWGLMALMVRLGVLLEKKGSSPSLEIMADEKTEAENNSSNIRKHQAAEAAVAYALAERANKKPKVALSDDLCRNAWQIAQRAQVLQGKTNIFASRSSRR
jgi:Na+-transporting methylmalonyl-CoA/oxaloacetate decarboxylase gamma subunit